MLYLNKPLNLVIYHITRYCSPKSGTPGMQLGQIAVCSQRAMKYYGSHFQKDYMYIVNLLQRTLAILCPLMVNRERKEERQREQMGVKRKEMGGKWQEIKDKGYEEKMEEDKENEVEGERGSGRQV